MKWEVVCCPKEYGGLGIGYIKERNLSLLGKWLWRFFNNSGGLWQFIIRNKYGMDRNGWDFTHGISPNMSLIWRHIIKIYPLFTPHIRLVVGNGKLIRFWDNVWWADQSLAIAYPWFFRLSSQRNVVIADVISPSLDGHLWTLFFKRDLFDWEVDTLAPLISKLENVYISNSFPDKGVWTFEFSGTFFYKSFFKGFDSS